MHVRSGRLIIDLDAFLPVLTTAPHVYVGVRTSTGPHVTPELFTISGEHLVCLTAASTLKAKVARREPIVAIAARTASGAMSGVATAEVFDPTQPGTAIDSPHAAAVTPAGVARFVRDNAAELVGAALDTLAGRLGAPPEHRIVLVIRLDDAMTVDDGGDVMLGWTRDDGTPLVLPARWEDDDRAVVSASLFEHVGAEASSPACITFDETTGPGPSGKQGVMLRGTGRSTRDGDVVRIALDVERTVEWDGVEVHSSTVD